MSTRFFTVFACCFAVFFLCLSIVPGQAYEKGKTHSLVYFNPDVTVEDPVAAVSAMKPFANFLGKKIGVNFEPYFFKKQVDVERFLDNNKVAFGIFSQMYIVENFRKRNFEPVGIVLKEGQPFYRKVILVRKDSPYETLMDLEGKTLATTNLGEDNIPFLNKVVFQGEIDVNTHFGKMQVVDSANSAIMAVLYRQADASAANYLNFEFLKELNPQVNKQLKSIYTSAQTPLPGLVCFRDNVSRDLADIVVKEMMVMHENPIGSQTMLAFQVEAWAPATINNWDETARLLNISLTGEPVEKQEPVLQEAQQTAPAQQVEKPKVDRSRVSFTRIAAIDREAENAVEIRVNISQEEPGIDPQSVAVVYSLSQGDTGSIKLAPADETRFSGKIPLPKQESSGENKKSTYIIKPGDTLGKIAKKTLGDSRKYMLIARLNNITNPNVIYAGAELIIMSGTYSGIDIKYTIEATDKNGSKHTSREKFAAIAR